MKTVDLYHKIQQFKALGFKEHQLSISLTRDTFDLLCKENSSYVNYNHTTPYPVISSIAGIPIYMGTENIVWIKL